MYQLSVFTVEGWVILGNIKSEKDANACAIEYALLMNEPVCCTEL